MFISSRSQACFFAIDLAQAKKSSLPSALLYPARMPLTPALQPTFSSYTCHSISVGSSLTVSQNTHYSSPLLLLNVFAVQTLYHGGALRDTCSSPQSIRPRGWFTLAVCLTTGSPCRSAVSGPCTCSKPLLLHGVLTEMQVKPRQSNRASEDTGIIFPLSSFCCRALPLKALRH